jgi:hypothetical protein
MAYFSINLELGATIYIAAPTLQKADKKLQRILDKTLDANDPSWFSDVALGDSNLPELSFATAMTIWGPLADHGLRELDYHHVERMMRSAAEGRKSRVFRGARSSEALAASAVYETHLRVMTKGFIKADFLGEAEAILVKVRTLAVRWENANQWFSTNGLSDRKLPLVLSPNMTILAIMPGNELEQAWPDEDDEEEEHDQPEELRSMPEESEFDHVVAGLKKHLSSVGGRFAKISDEEVREVAKLLVARPYNLARTTAKALDVVDSQLFRENRS